MKQCKYCNFLNLDESIVCSQCGNVLNQTMPMHSQVRCTECGSLIPSGAILCPDCGNPVGMNTKPGQERENIAPNPSSIRRFLPFLITAVCALVLIIGLVVVRGRSVEADDVVVNTQMIHSMRINSDEIAVGETTAVVLETERENQSVSWESDDESIAVVDDYGNVTGIAEGEARITARIQAESESVPVRVVQSSRSSYSILAEQQSIKLGQSITLVLEGPDGIVSSSQVRWKSSDKSVASVSAEGLVTAHTEGVVTISASCRNESAEIEITVSKYQHAKGLGAIPLSTLEELPESIEGGTWETDKEIQGVEWNTDTMETFYICYNKYIVPYRVDGTSLKHKDAETAQFTSLDYYNGKLFTVMRSRNDGRFKLRVYDAETLELLNSTDLTDIHQQFKEDKKEYGENIIPCIDGITVAPQIGSERREKLYISYNAYYSESESLALHSEQKIYEYDLKKAIRQDDSVKAERVLTVDLGFVEQGIQTLEYDRSTGMIWCAVRQGLNDYSLYCLDTSAQGNRLTLVPNGEQEGWDCPQAADGLCSLGHDWYYVLVPTYYNNAAGGEIKKVQRESLESIGE